MIILYRASEANKSPGSVSDGSQDKPRWNGRKKDEIFRKCWLSLQQDLEGWADRIVVLADKVTEETKQWMRDTCIIPTKLEIRDIPPRTEVPPYGTHPYPQYHPVTINTCIPFMETLIQLCEEYPEEVIYCCEDDYLHTRGAIKILKNLYSAGYEGFYLPYDYPDRYFDRDRHCEVLVGPDCHLKTVCSATLTMAGKGKTYLPFKYSILQAGIFSDDSWTWKAFRQGVAVCPLPGTSTHLQDNCITPVVDWNEVWNQW